jgi:hypothetical protein
MSLSLDEQRDEYFDRTRIKLREILDERVWHENEMYDSWLDVGWGTTIRDDYPADDLHLHEFPFGEPPSFLFLAMEISERRERGL